MFILPPFVPLDNPVVARRNVNTSLEEVLLISIGCVTTAVVIGGILYRFYKRRRRLLKYAGTFGVLKEGSKKS